MKLESLDQLLEEQLKDLFSAENQLVKALPKLAKKASNPALVEAIKAHLEETEGQIKRLQEIEQKLDIKLSGKKCKAMEGLIEEGAEALEMDGDENLVDLLIVAAAQRVEHYEIAAYGTARAIAEQLEQSDVVQLLQETLEEEAACDEKLSDISFEELYPNVDSGDESSYDEEDASEEDEETKTGRPSQR
jgi:ferritin-like metal-binding protein YciE